MKVLISSILGHKTFIWMLLIINILGTLYGYYWYKWQMVQTPLHFLPFVPDSPTASLFFVFVLIAFLRGKNWPLMEALAAITLLKYGVWAVGMNLAGGLVSGSLDFVNVMLIFSHLGMAIEGLLYTPYYKIKTWHLMVASIWVLHNEIIDYVFGMMPRYSALNDYIAQIGYITFWLSLLSIFTIYVLTIQRQRNRSLSTTETVSNVHD